MGSKVERWNQTEVEGVEGVGRRENDAKMIWKRY